LVGPIRAWAWFSRTYQGLSTVQSNQSILFSFSCGGLLDLVKEVNTGEGAAELK
jgi:hypothetical protein